MDKQFISSTEAAKLLGISRIAVFNKIKKGDIKARKIGRNYAIAVADLDIRGQKQLNNERMGEIDRAVKKTMKEYGETIKLLGNA